MGPKSLEKQFEKWNPERLEILEKTEFLMM
jgi:hypothetical protein